jgi:hypothetical protein
MLPRGSVRTPKTQRVFLRASTDCEAPRSGGRYTCRTKDVPTLKGRFAKWQAEREAAPPPPAATTVRPEAAYGVLLDTPKIVA